MEPQKESSKSTVTEFIYACHFLWGTFILQAVSKIRVSKLAFIVSSSHSAVANSAMLLVQKET